MIVPLLAVTDEKAWLVSQMRGLAIPDLEWRVLEPKLSALPPEGSLVIATDDVGHPRLRAVLRAAVQRIGAERCVLSVWGEHPDIRPLKGALPDAVVYLPAEADRLVDWVRGIHEPGVLEDLTRYLRRDLAPALRHALHFILERSGNPHGPSPPPSVSALTRILKLDESNLRKRAKAVGVNVVTVLRYARARWILARIRQPSDLPEAVRTLGYASAEPVGALLGTVVGCTPSQAWRVDPDTVTGPLLEALGDTVDLSDEAA